MKWQQCQLTTKIRIKTPKTIFTLPNIYSCNDKSVSFKYLVFNSFLRKANLIENHSYTRKLSDLDRYCWLLRDLRDSFSNIEQSVPSYCYKVLYNIQSLNADVKGKSFRKYLTTSIILNYKNLSPHVISLQIILWPHRISSIFKNMYTSYHVLIL